MKRKYTRKKTINLNHLNRIEITRTEIKHIDINVNEDMSEKKKN